MTIGIAIGANSIGVRAEILVALVAGGKSLILAICVLTFSVAEEEVVFACDAVSCYYVYCVAEWRNLSADSAFWVVALIAGQA